METVAKPLMFSSIYFLPHKKQSTTICFSHKVKPPKKLLRLQQRAKDVQSTTIHFSGNSKTPPTRNMLRLEQSLKDLTVNHDDAILEGKLDIGFKLKAKIVSRLNKFNELLALKNIAPKPHKPRPRGPETTTAKYKAKLPSPETTITKSKAKVPSPETTTTKSKAKAKLPSPETTTTKSKAKLPSPKTTTTKSKAKVPSPETTTTKSKSKKKK